MTHYNVNLIFVWLIVNWLVALINLDHGLELTIKWFQGCFAIRRSGFVPIP